MGKVYLTAEEIKRAQDLKPEKLSIPEWGGDLLIRGASVKELDDWDESNTRRKVEGDKVEVTMDFRNYKARLVVKCLVDEEGDRLFTDEEADVLGAKSSSAVNRCFQRIMVLSGRDKKTVKELEGNLSGENEGTSNSSSPGT